MRHKQTRLSLAIAFNITFRQTTVEYEITFELLKEFKKKNCMCCKLTDFKNKYFDDLISQNYLESKNLK